MNNDEKSVKSLPFSGKASEFPIWKFKFLAMCAYQNCEDILIDDTYVITKEDPTVTLTSTETAAREAAIKQNKTAFMLLSLCITPSDTITFGAVQNAKTDELPKGDAKKAWHNICDINQPTSRTALHILGQQFNQCDLQEDINPDKGYLN